MRHPSLLVGDWGTTNLRAWTLDAEGHALAARDFALGVSKLRPGEAARRFQDEVVPAFDGYGLPALFCGMVGSDLGWTRTPYLDCPVGADDLARAVVTVGAPSAVVRIVPGARGQGPTGAVDVMRGEETQLFGWLALHPERARGRQVICHPGTHAKWMVVEEGRLTRFATAMTGELFAVLGKHSVLRSEAPANDDAAFAEGLAAAGEGDGLAARLFTVRARVVGGQAAVDSTSSYLSGLLIGAEVASLPRLLGLAEDTPIVLLGDAALCARYARAFDARGVKYDVFDGEAAALAGLFSIYRKGEEGHDIQS